MNTAAALLRSGSVPDRGLGQRSKRRAPVRRHQHRKQQAD
jgi:hypothetical protein